MTAADVDPTIMNWLYAREVMRRIGFTPDEIHLEVGTPDKLIDGNGDIVDNPTRAPVVQVLVKRGELAFRWTMGTTAVAYDQLQAHFEMAANAWNENSLGTTDLDFLMSMPMRQSVALLRALQSKGFDLQILREQESVHNN